MPVVAVQHHVAHVAAVAAERRWNGPLLGVALDGQGFGTDGAPWGGELIALDGARWERVGSFEPLALPGGDKAAREPWRMGVAMLERLGRARATRRASYQARPRPGGSPTRCGAARGLPGRRAAGACSTPPQLWRASASSSITRDRRRWSWRRWSRRRASLPGGWIVADGRLDLAPNDGGRCSIIGFSVREAAEAFHGTLIAGLAEWISAAARERGNFGALRSAAGAW